MFLGLTIVPSSPWGWYKASLEDGLGYPLGMVPSTPWGWVDIVPGPGRFFGIINKSRSQFRNPEFVFSHQSSVSLFRGVGR